MDAATYWRLRYLQAVSELAMRDAASAEARYRAALTAAGIDPAVPYRWDDSGTDLVPAAPGEQDPR